MARLPKRGESYRDQQRVPRRRVSTFYLCRTLEALETAIGNASSDGIVPYVKASSLRAGCSRYAHRLMGDGWWDAVPFGTLVMRPILYANRRRTAEKARLHAESCLEFLQRGIDIKAASLDDDAPFEVQVAATIELLTAATDIEGSSHS